MSNEQAPISQAGANVMGFANAPGDLVIGIWDLMGIWELGHWDFCVPDRASLENKWSGPKMVSPTGG